MLVCYQTVYFFDSQKKFSSLFLERAVPPMWDFFRSIFRLSAAKRFIISTKNFKNNNKNPSRVNIHGGCRFNVLFGSWEE